MYVRISGNWRLIGHSFCAYCSCRSHNIIFADVLLFKGDVFTVIV